MQTYLEAVWNEKKGQLILPSVALWAESSGGFSSQWWEKLVLLTVGNYIPEVAFAAHQLTLTTMLPQS